MASRRGLVLSLGVVVALGAAIAHGAEPLRPWSGGPAPSLVLLALDESEVTLASFRGRTVIVNFWATWCGPCVAEMPALQRTREKLSPEGVEVIAVNLRESAARIAPFVEQWGLSFPVVRDSDGAASRAWGVNVFPTSFVVGPDGRIAWFVRGEVDWDSAQVVSQIRRANRKSPVPSVYSAEADPPSIGPLKTR